MVPFPYQAHVLAQRKQHYAESDTYRMLPGDARQTDWTDALPEAEAAILVLEGITMYIKPQELATLLSALRSRYARLHVLADCYTTFGAKASKWKNPIQTVGVTQTYGLDDPSQLAEQAGLRFIKEHDLAPADLIAQLSKPEQRLFCKLFAGGFAKKLYRCYEWQGVAPR